LIADRYFNAERVLAVLHLAGGILLLALARATAFTAFLPVLFAYMALYMPTLALANSISFRQLKDPAREFGPVRVWGTIGWIAAGVAISYVFAWDSPTSLARGALRNTFTMCGCASLLLGLYSFTLPKTPPAAKGQAHKRLRDILGADALGLLAERNFLIFFLASKEGSYIQGQTIALDGGWTKTKYLSPEALTCERVEPSRAPARGEDGR